MTQKFIFQPSHQGPNDVQTKFPFNTQHPPHPSALTHGCYKFQMAQSRCASNIQLRDALHAGR